jgi:hypothetical protein
MIKAVVGDEVAGIMHAMYKLLMRLYPLTDTEECCRRLVLT